MIPVERAPWPGNDEGCKRYTLPTAARMIRDGSRDVRRIQPRAFQVLIAAGNPKSIRGKAQAILDHVRATVVETEDPPGTEVVKAAHLTLCAAEGGGRAGGEECIPGGDCDEGLVAIGALLGAAGIDNQIVAIDHGGGRQPHVCNAFKDESRTWLVADFRGPGVIEPLSAIRAARAVLVDPLDPSLPGATPGGEFIGVGKRSVKEALEMAAATQPTSYMDVVVRRAGAGGLLFVDPGDVLAYRRAWEPYVVGSVAQMRICADAVDAFAASIAKARPQDAQVYATIAAEMRTAAGTPGQNDGTIARHWNRFAGLTDSQISAGASDILRGHRATMLEVTFYRNQAINLGCTSGWPHPPSLLGQMQIAARLEGLGIFARGTLGIMQESIAGIVDFTGRQIDNAWTVVKSPWLWIAVATVAAGGVAIVYAPEIKTTLAARRKVAA